MSTGRPLKFKSPEELQEKIDAYFADADEKGWPYTISDLALALDTSRRTLLDYQEKESYSHTVSRAKLRIQAFAERSLFTARNTNGIMFSLTNNWGWVQKQEVKQDVTLEGGLDVRLMESRQRVREALEKQKDAPNSLNSK